MRWARLAILFFAAACGSFAQQPQANYRIAGVVIDAVNGAPVAQANVSVSLKGDQIDVTAGDDGRFVFDGLEPGKYHLSATALGYMTESYNQHLFYSTAIAAGKGLDSEHIVFRLHRQAVIYGTVTNERGEPVRHAQVMLFGVTPGQNQTPAMREGTGTDDLGQYRFAHLLPGEYYVAVQTQPWYAQPGANVTPSGDSGGFRTSFGIPKADPALDVVYPITFFPAATEEHNATPLRLGAGESEEANVQLVAVPDVHVRLTNLPVDLSSLGIGAQRKIFGSFGAGEPAFAVKVSDSEYEIAGLLPGDTTLHIEVSSGLDHTTRTIEGEFSTTNTVNASTARAGSKVSGRAMFTSGMAASGVTISLGTSGGPSFSAQSQKDGSFSFDSVPAGVYYVAASSPSANDEYVQRLFATGARASVRQLTIEGSSDVHLTITMGQGRGQVTGLAQINGQPADGVMILLVPQSGENIEEDSRMDQSDSDGTFTLANIVPGKYILMAIDGGWDLDWRDPAVMKPFQEKGKWIEITSNQTEKVKIEAQPRLDAQQGAQ